MVIGLFVALIVGTFAWLTFSPKPTPPPPAVLTDEAKAYLPNFALGDVHMQAAESYAQQRLVEVLGNITNNGPRTVKLVEVVCVFKDFNGAEARRERALVVGGRTGALAPGATKPFRLAFDNAPDNWNQVMPSLVIAQIQFE